MSLVKVAAIGKEKGKDRTTPALRRYAWSYAWR
jgi:hypothetical protein